MEALSKMDNDKKAKALDKMKNPELKEILRKSSVWGYHNMRKAELLSKICDIYGIEKEKDPGIWHGYGYQDIHQDILKAEAKRLGVARSSKIGKNNLKKKYTKLN